MRYTHLNRWKLLWPLRRYCGRIFDRNPGIREIFACEIWNPGFWSPESGNPTDDWNSESKFYWQILESSRISIFNNDFKVPSTCTFRNIHSVFKNFNSGQRIQKVADSPWPETCGRKPNPHRKSCEFNSEPKCYLECLNVHHHLEFCGVFSCLSVNNKGFHS